MTTLDSKSSSNAPATSLDTQENIIKTSTNTDQAPTAASVDNGPVQAYAKLEGQHYCYYIRTLQVTLGRKVNGLEKTDKVDIPLGNTKSVSRQHARLFYNFTTQRFEMMVIGKNGAFVNDQFIERGMTVPLENRTKITIGETQFIFLLPYMDSEEGNNNNNSRNDTGSYLSTPQQLEKQRKRKAPQQANSLPSTSGNNSNQVEDEEEEEVDEELKKTMIGYPGVPNPYIGKDDKPPFSYANLIAQAINNASTDKKMTLNEIYTYLSTTYPYFKKVSSTGWQNSVRHNLSLNKAFIKLPRSNSDSGKGAFWTIDPKLEYSIFATNVPMKQRNSKRGSAASSPATSSKDGDEDSSSTKVVTTGTPTKKQRKDKATKDADDSKVKKDPITTNDLPASAENAASSSTTSLSGSIVPTNSTASPSTAISHDNAETPSTGSTYQDNKTSKPKQRKSSKSKVAVPPLSPSSTSMTTTTESPGAKPVPSLAVAPTSLALASAVVTGATTNGTPGQEAPTNIAKPPTDPSPNVQAQLQLQLQNTIRQHLLDPIRNPLPPTIAQLLPQAIAQLPPQIANQLSSTLNVALRAQQQHQLQQQQQQQQQQKQQEQQQHTQQNSAENNTSARDTPSAESTTTVPPLSSASTSANNAVVEEKSIGSESSTLDDKIVTTSTPQITSMSNPTATPKGECESQETKPSNE